MIIVLYYILKRGKIIYDPLITLYKMDFVNIALSYLNIEIMYLIMQEIITPEHVLKRANSKLRNLKVVSSCGHPVSNYVIVLAINEESYDILFLKEYHL
jgi:hypothetical protein